MQRRLEDEKKSMKNVYKFQCGQVKLNQRRRPQVHHISHNTKESTRLYASSYMFSERHQLATDEDGAYLNSLIEIVHITGIFSCNYLRDDTNL